jgi:hypothetical protein
MIKRIRGMFTRLKALLIAALMATIFPALRIGGTPGGDPPAGDPPAAPPVKTPEQRIAELEGELAGRGARISDLEKEAKEVNKLAITKLAEIDGVNRLQESDHRGQSGRAAGTNQRGDHRGPG